MQVPMHDPNNITPTINYKKVQLNNSKGCKNVSNSKEDTGTTNMKRLKM
jgi:hypothetical protein